MCCRFTLTQAEVALRRKLRLGNPPPLKARHNIAPGQPIAAARASADGTRALAILSWGLVPFWAKDPAIGHRLLNARAETAAVKPAFKGPLRHHRCLIPADGFFEWTGRTGHKQPWYFRQADHEPFCFAGLADHWGAPDGSEIESAAILTTAANDWMRPIHDRMPIVIHERDYDRWLDPDCQRPDGVRNLLVAPPDDFFIRHAVDPAVNRVAAEGPACIEPIPEPSRPPDQLGLAF